MADWEYYTTNRSGRDRWSPRRIGTVAKATTAPGTAPAYGMAFQLGSAGLDISSSEFAQLARDLSLTTQAEKLQRIEAGTIGPLHDLELEIAFNHARVGYGMPNEDFRNAGGGGFWDDVMTGFNMAKSELGNATMGVASSAREASRMIPVVGGWLPFTEDEDDKPSTDELYEEYTKANGALTEEEFTSFPYETQVFLNRRAKGTLNLKEAAQIPGISHALQALNLAYRGMTTVAEMNYQAADWIGAPTAGTGPLAGVLAMPDIYFRKDRWAQAWKESNRKSFGSALLDGVIAPFYSDEELTELRKNSSLYDISAGGLEFATGWYADAGVIAARGLGNLGRVARKEVPLGGQVSDEVQRLLAGQELGPQGGILSKPTQRYAKWRAENILKGREGVEEYARHVSAAEFARLPMFRNHRTAGGAPAAFALHKAINGLKSPGGEDLLNLTWGAFHADPQALSTIRKMSEDPGELSIWGPDAQTFLDAYEAVRTKATVLEQELDNITLSEGGDSLTPFHRWEIHADQLVKEEQLRQATDALNNYGDYGAWLDSTLSGIHGAQVKGPSQLTWNKVEKRQTEGVRRTFMDNQYGWAHSFESIPRNLWTRKSNVAFMDDIDSGVRAINRQFDEFRQLGWDDLESRNQWVESWMSAETNTDRYKVLYEMEETLVDSVVARRLDLDPEIIRVVREKIRAEQNRTKQAILSGQGQIYDTAPSLGQRVFDELDTTATLVGRNPDTGMVTLNILDGKQMRTFEVPDESLEPHVSPLDTTQTPRVFQPIDLRRFYLEVKRHRDVLDSLDAGAVRRGGAGAMQVIDIIGTKFHNVWKPMQLWRPAWPMRVMMDEGFRAMSIFGPMYWLTGPGAEAIGAGVRNMPYHLQQAVSWAKHGPMDLAMPGPRTRAMKASPNPMVRDAEVAAAVQVPAPRWPKVNAERHAKLMEELAPAERHLRAAVARESLADELRRQVDPGHDLPKGRKPIKAADGKRPLRESPLPGTTGVDPAELAGQMTAGKYIPEAAARAETTMAETADLYRYAAVSKIRNRLAMAMDEGAGNQRVFDPVTGQEVSNGYAVPVFTAGTRSPRGGRQNELNWLHWLNENAELLSRKGMRVLVDADGQWHIVRWYANRKGAFTKAKDFLLDVEHTGLPEGVDHAWMLDVGKRKTFHVQSRDSLSKVYEDILNTADRAHSDPWTGTVQRRGFKVGPEYELQPDLGDAPAEEVGAVYHGASGDGLPQDLAPRTDVPVASGRMMGEGLYTSVDLDVVRQYADGDVRKIYTIRGSRSGQQYEVFDMDAPMTDQDMQQVMAWLEDPSRREVVWGDFDYDGPRDAASEMRDWLGRAQVHSSRTFYPDSETPTWAQWMEVMEGYPDYQRKLTEFLETERNAGALTHRGGTSWGDGHQVYVWLHPEDLEVVPAYAPTAQMRAIEDWFYDPDSMERLVEVPEDRMIRYGTRNPALRRLHTIHAKRMELEKGLSTKDKWKNAARNELAKDEKELMRALGLEYVEDDVSTISEILSDTPDPVSTPQPVNRMGQDWYMVADQDRWNRMVSEAEAIDAQRDRALKAQRDIDPNLMSDSAVDFDLDLWRYIRDFEETIDDPRGWLEHRLHAKREFGKGWATIASSDGQNFKVPNVFEDHDGEMVRGLVSSAKTIDYLSEGHGRALDMMQRRGMRQQVFSPPVLDAETLKRGTQKYQKAVLYYQKWADTLNDTVARSPVYNRMLRGQSDEQIVDWLDKTHEGARFRQEIFYDGQSTELFVMEARDRLEYLLPDPALRRQLAERPLRPSDLKRGVHEADRPDVMGSDVDPAERRWWTKLADNMWHSLGTIPIDRLSRHPTAKAFYDQKMAQLIGTSKGEYLTPEVLDQYRKIAHTHTLQEIRHTLFDLSDQTNFTDAIRFMAPFWNAQEEAMTKWLRIVMDRPETMARFFVGQRALYKNFVVVDEDGKEVDSNVREGGFLGLYNPSDRVVIQLPEWMDAGALKYFGSVRIPIASANTAFQGEMPLFPGPGPMLTVPIDKFARWASETHGVTHSEESLYKWLYPVGRPTGGWRGVMEQLFPGYGRRLQSATGPEDDISKVNMRFMIEREMRLDNERKGLPPPTDAQVREATNFMWTVRFFTSWGAPVQMQYAPKHQFWLDQAQEFRQKYGAAYMDHFIEEYGAVAAAYAVSSSTSEAGVPPTITGMKSFEKNRGLIAKYPHWGAAIIDPNSFLDEYSQDAYEAQFEIPIGAGQPGTMRRIYASQERFDYAQQRVGWLEYRKFNSALQAELFARGLTSLNSNGAEDLRQLKAATINRFAQEYPSWYEDYSNWSNDIYSRIRELEQIAFRKEFNMRPDMLGVRQYLQIRAAAGERLDENYDRGGSRSLQADENGALRMWFYDQVGQLIQENPAFGEFYSRYLDGDTLELGSGLYGTQP